MFPTSPILAALAKISTPFKRSSLGLFHGKLKQYGNNVPFSKKKTRRTWLPNVQNKRLPSDALGRKVEVKVTTRALRTVHKHGGLDQYLLKTRAELLGYEGMRLRLLVRDALQAKADADAAAKHAESEVARQAMERKLAEDRAARAAEQREHDALRRAQAKKQRRQREAVAVGLLGAQSGSDPSSKMVR